MTQSGRFAHALRVIVWVLLLWILVRGVVSFLPAGSVASARQAEALAGSVAEPPGLRSFPARFIREYLTWQPADQDGRALRLAAFTTPGLDLALGNEASTVSQRVETTWIDSVKAVSPSRWLVTVVALVSRSAERTPTSEAPETDAAAAAPALPPAIVYLAVPVGRTAEGGWVVYDFPTLVPPPVTGTFTEPLHFGTEVPDENDQIRRLLDRFFPAYLSANESDLAYLLAPEAAIRTFQSPWIFDSIANLVLSQTDSGLYVLSEVVLVDPVTGARFRNRYTVALQEREGRWYISDILQEGE